MLYQKFELVKETDEKKLFKLYRNGHSPIVFVKTNEGIKKILISHGSESGTISDEVDLATVLYDSFDFIICCHPNQVKNYFRSKYGKNLPVMFPEHNYTIWTKLYSDGKIITLEVSDRRDMSEELKEEEDSWENMLK